MVALSSASSIAAVF